MNNLNEEVIIVGAGPVGLLLGCWLRKLGIGVTILEKRLRRGNESKASSMNAYSLAILHALGIEHQFDAIGKRVHELELSWENKRLFRVDYRKLPSIYDHILCLEQPKSETLLESHFFMLGGKLQRGIEVIGVTQDESDYVVVGVRDETGQERALTSKFLIGCDGGKSSVREQLGYSFDGVDLGTGFIMVDAKITWTGENSRVYYHVSENAFFILIPLSDGVHRLIIKTENNEKEVIAGDKLNAYQSLVDKYGPPNLKVKEIIWESHTTYYNRLAEKYGHGRVWLAGDACHLFSSIGGLGMNTGFQDAIGLAWRLAGVLRKRLSESVLDTYELERRTLAQFLIATTNETTALITRTNQDPNAVKDWLPLMSNRNLLNSLPLKYSGLGQRYETGLLDANRISLVGQLVPYFSFTHEGSNKCSYDLIDAQHFCLIAGNCFIDPNDLAKFDGVVKLIRIQMKEDWASISQILNLQVDEILLMRPDGIVAAKTTASKALELINTTIQLKHDEVSN